MEGLITAAITSFIGAVIGALVSALVTRTRGVTSEQSALRDSMRALLKAELYDLHHRYVDLDEPLDAMGMQLASSVYEIYHDRLGGNGLGTRLYEDIAEKGITK